MAERYSDRPLSRPLRLKDRNKTELTLDVRVEATFEEESRRCSEPYLDLLKELRRIYREGELKAIRDEERKCGDLIDRLLDERNRRRNGAGS